MRFNMMIRIHRTYYTKLKKTFVRQYSQVVLQDQSEYTDVPQYPKILDMSLKGRKLREREELHEKIRKIRTVEEKQIALNMPKYYGWGSVILNEDKVPYNAMPLVQCYTRSHFIPVEKLPDAYNGLENAADSVIKEIKHLVEDAIAMENEGVQRNFSPSLEKPEQEQIENELSKCIVRQINRIITNNLSNKVSHILSTQVDYDPRHEAFWFVGGTNVPERVIKDRKQFPWLKDRLHEPVNRPVQYLGKPFLTLRGHQPLQPILPYSEAENPDFKVTKFSNDPKMVGYFTDFRHGTNIPGFWPGDYDEYGLLSIHGRGHLLTRNNCFGPQDHLEALHCQAMTASFGWLLAQANYQGFTTFHDITYPLVTQTVITNGQLWSLYAYQLNTIVMHDEKMDENPKHNICFGTKPLKLYDTIEDGNIKGLNEDVLKMLVQLYMNSPLKRDYEMKPYLGVEEKIVADIEFDNKRCWLEDAYKHLVSNRPRHLLAPEVYHWEKIYKIQHNTRFFEAKRRPFELGINPYKRTLNEHLPTYIPKVLRKYPRSKKKFESVYYPKLYKN